MPYIKVNVANISRYASEFSAINTRSSRIKQDFMSIGNNIDWDVVSSANIKSRLSAIDYELDKELSAIRNINTFLNNTSLQYKNIDETISGRINDSDDMDYDTSDLPESETTVQLNNDESKKVIKELARDYSESEDNIFEKLKAGLIPVEDIMSKLEHGTDHSGKLLNFLTGASGIAYELNSAGQIIVKHFTRSSIINKVTKTLHGAGIAPHYTPSTLLKTPGIGTLYALKKVAEGVEIVTSAIKGGIKIVDGAGKISDILSDDSLSGKEKACKATAVGITSAVGAALDVAAPFAGKAVTTAVTALIPIPGVNIVAGAVAGFAVKEVMGIAADVITSEVVVNQVSEAVSNIGDAVSSGVQTVSDAGKKLLESKNAGDAVANTVKLVGTAAVETTKVIATVVVEKAKVVTTVVAETAKAVVNKVADVGKTVFNFFKKW